MVLLFHGDFYIYLREDHSAGPGLYRLMMPMPLFCHGSFKDIQQISVPLGFHFAVGNKSQGCTVDTVSDSIGGFRIIFKDMAQMGIACPAAHLRPLHPIAVICNLYNGRFFNGFCKGGPAAAALVFIR